jgi:integrase
MKRRTCQGAEIEGDIWTIPAGRYKTNVDFEVPLSQAAQAVLAGVTRAGKFLFTTTGDAPISGLPKWRRSFDDDMIAELRKIAKDRGDDPTLLARIATVEELWDKIARAKGAGAKRELAKQ